MKSLSQIIRRKFFDIHSTSKIQSKYKSKQSITDIEDKFNQFKEKDQYSFLSNQIPEEQKVKLLNNAEQLQNLNSIEKYYLQSCINHINSEVFNDSFDFKSEYHFEQDLINNPQSLKMQQNQSKPQNTDNVETNESLPVDEIETKIEEETKEEKSIFNIKLVKIDSASKLKVIKELRTLTGLGLKESKELVEKLPSIIIEKASIEVKENVSKLLGDLGCELEFE